MILILGAGIAGLSASYHIGHEQCLLLEQHEHAFGHVASERRDGFTWDLGPHVSFTKHEYVRRLFQLSVGEQFEEIEVQVGNYYKGHWIAHPAQTSLHQIPEPVRSACLKSFLSTRDQINRIDTPAVVNYQQWLEQAFGPVFANTFPCVYARKYWTRDATDLTTDWIGNRILYPNVDDVKEGAVRALGRSMHYITRVRYPRHGGYQAFAEGLRAGSRIAYGASVASIDLASRKVWLADGRCFDYDKLVNTLPLPVFVNACLNVPSKVIEATRQLSCTQLLLVNIAVPHTTRRPEHWAYVYDEEKLTSRINCTEKLSPNNAPRDWTGVQAEVYFSRHRPLPATPSEVAVRVEEELIEMGLIVPSRYTRGMSSYRHVKHAPWANVIFDHDTVPALKIIWQWLESFGLARDSYDLHPLTNWERALASPELDAELFMAGRFGQWKYFWTDDCVLRGRQISES